MNDPPVKISNLIRMTMKSTLKNKKKKLRSRKKKLKSRKKKFKIYKIATLNLKIQFNKKLNKFKMKLTQSSICNKKTINFTSSKC